MRITLLLSHQVAHLVSVIAVTKAQPVARPLDFCDYARNHDKILCHGPMGDIRPQDLKLGP